MRAFIAIELAHHIRKELAQIRNRGMIKGRGIRWVKPESIHLTLKFLGNIDLETVHNVTRAMRNASQNLEPFDIELGGFGCFPKKGKPRVFWIGVTPSNSALEVLFRRMEEDLEEIGFKKEKRAFSPHITLARIKGNLEEGPVDRGSTVIGEQEVPEIVLFQSELKPSGAVYVPLAKVPLAYP